MPEEIDDIRYSVLDYSNPADPDYFFHPLVFLEIYNAPAAVLRIGDHVFKMPMDWNVIISDADSADPEIIPIASICDKGFSAFCLNPISSYMPSYLKIDVIDIYQEVKWHFPKLKPGSILSVPLTSEPGSLCAFFVKETNKIPDVLDINELW